MRTTYDYIMQKGCGSNRTTTHLTLKELRNELNKFCVSHVDYIQGLGYIDATDVKKVESVIRKIKSGTHYIFCGDNVSFHAVKIK